MNYFEKLQNQYDLGKQIPKEHWIKEISVNRDIIACIESEKLNCFLHFCMASKNYAKFITNLHFDKVLDVDINDRTYRQIIDVPTEKGKKQQNLQMFSNNVAVIKTKDFQITLSPYNNGVMIQGFEVNLNKRGKGIGTKVMNTLYNLSERLDIPLYLTPYPDEIEPNLDNLWVKIHRLRKWYSDLGFGSVFGTDWVWSNYYEEDIK
jgi:hypothetical protein